MSTPSFLVCASLKTSVRVHTHAA